MFHDGMVVVQKTEKVNVVYVRMGGEWHRAPSRGGMFTQDNVMAQMLARHCGDYILVCNVNDMIKENV